MLFGPEKCDFGQFSVELSADSLVLSASRAASEC